MVGVLPAKKGAWISKFRPFQTAARAMGLCTGRRGRIHTLFIISAIFCLAIHSTFNIDFASLEGSSVRNAALEAGKTIVGSVGAIACLGVSIRQFREEEGLAKRLEEATIVLDLEAFSLRMTSHRSIALALLLIANCLFDVFAFDSFSSQYSGLVEYYNHLLLQVTECQFVAQVQTLTAMYEVLRAKLASSRPNSQLAMTWIRSEQHLFKLSTQVSDLFGHYLLASISTNFVAILINLYFSQIHLIRRYSAGETIPLYTIMYFTLNLYILLRIYQVLSCAQTLQTKDSIHRHIQARQNLVMYADNLLRLDFSILTEMVGAWTTFLVILLQFELKPCPQA